MEQRDFLKDQIDQLGKILGEVLAQFIGLKTHGNISEAVAITNQALKSKLDIDVNKLSTLSVDELEAQIASKHMTDHHLDQLSEYCLEIITYTDDQKQSDRLVLLAKHLLDIADTISQEMNINRFILRKRTETYLNS